jgi:hypothetical protein
MRRACTCLLPALGLFFAGSRRMSSEPVALTRQATPPKPHQARTDLYGDPLPKGSIARLGMTRFRFRHLGFVVSPDRQTIALGFEKISLRRRFSHLAHPRKAGGDFRLCWKKWKGGRPPPQRCCESFAAFRCSNLLALRRPNGY